MNKLIAIIFFTILLQSVSFQVLARFLNYKDDSMEEIGKFKGAGNLANPILRSGVIPRQLQYDIDDSVNLLYLPNAQRENHWIPMVG